MDSHRDSGCTLTGALSVSTEISRCITLVHGPPGCAHHNFSLLHALHAARDRPSPPLLFSTGMSEQEVIFGGEQMLKDALLRAASRGPELICVLSTCVAAMIGDDVDAACEGIYQVPVVHIPTGGFLGGCFLDGHISALISLSRYAEECEPTLSVNLIGEKTLEFEVDEHYREIHRLLSLIGIPINVRFVCGATFGDLAKVGAASLNILRDPSMGQVGEHLLQQHGIPYHDSFPLGLEGTLQFLERVGAHFSIDVSAAIEKEEAIQRAMMREFSALRGKKVSFMVTPEEGSPFLYGYELAQVLDLDVQEHGDPVPLPHPFPVGTSGIRRLLQRWRRSCHA